MHENAAEAVLEDERLKAILESLLFAAGEPVGLTQLANALENVPREDIKRALTEMSAGYASGGRGVVLEEVAGGYQLRTPREHALYVRRLLAAKPPRLSRPLLETLAIVAYRQPITRPEIEQLRGVDTGGVLDTLVERGLLRIAGRKEAPGRPIMYATTPEFLELFGLKDLDGLPDLEEFRALEGIRGDLPEHAADQTLSTELSNAGSDPVGESDRPAEEPVHYDSGDAKKAAPQSEPDNSGVDAPSPGADPRVGDDSEDDNRC